MVLLLEVFRILLILHREREVEYLYSWYLYALGFHSHKLSKDLLLLLYD